MLKANRLILRTNKIMNVKIKLKHIIILTLLLMLSIVMFSSFAIEKTRDEGCYDIKREIGLCSFFVNNQTQKNVCINNLKEKYGKVLFNKCAN